MGIRRKKESVKWTEELMQQKLVSFRSTARYILQNLYVFGWESDILFLSKSGFWTEIEIKVSRADFKADLKNKTEKHAVLSDGNARSKPNQFFYAVPDGLLQQDEIPPYAGLVTVDENCFFSQTRKPAPWLHRSKISPEELELADKFYYNMMDAKRKAIVAMRKAGELTDAYGQGYDNGRQDTIRNVLRYLAETCPYRRITDGGRIHCGELDRTMYGICHRGLCRYLEEKENGINEFSR